MRATIERLVACDELSRLEYRVPQGITVGRSEERQSGAGLQRPSGNRSSTAEAFSDHQLRRLTTCRPPRRSLGPEAAAHPSSRRSAARNVAGGGRSRRTVRIPNGFFNRRKIMGTCRAVIGAGPSERDLSGQPCRLRFARLSSSSLLRGVDEQLPENVRRGQW